MKGMTDPPPAAPRRAAPIRWFADDGSRRILAAYARRHEKPGEVLRRALRMLAIADGVQDPRGHIRREQPARRS